MAIVATSGGILDLNQALYDYGVMGDTVIVINAASNNTIYTWEGNDTVYTTRVNAGFLQNVYLGFENDRFFGGACDDWVRDGKGNDTVYLGDGIDRAYVGEGNDYIDGGANTDFLFFNERYVSDNGTSVPNYNPVTVDLLKTTAQNLGYFGIDTLLNFENIVGSNAADKLYGTNGANILSGSDGNDLIDGRAGDDTINGDQGADIIIGGAGKDTMLGGPEIVAARDTFRYLALTDSTASTATSDIIQLFDTGVTATDDRIDLSAIDTNAAVAGDQGFVWRNTLAFTTSSAWEVRLQVSGADTIVQVDNDSDTAAEMVILVQGVTGLTSWDFIL